VALNGNAITEGEFNAAFCRCAGVPVIFASGDDAAVEELKTRLGSIETAETKKSLSFHSAETLTPEAFVRRIAAGVKWALERLPQFPAVYGQDAGDARDQLQELYAGPDASVI